MARIPPVRVVETATRVRNSLQNLTRKMAPAPVQVLELASGFMTTQAVYAATKLGIPDALATGSQSAEAIAAAVGANADATHRLLRACSSLGVFTVDRSGRYANSAMSEQLRCDVETSIRPVVLMLGAPAYWAPWGELTYSVRTGKPSADKVFGKSMWAQLADEPEFEATFNEAMSCLTRLDWPTIDAVYDFSKFGTIVDVGGGQGQLLALILESAPQSNGILFDQESTIAQAAEFLGNSGVLPRCTLECGSFFETVPAGGDLYILRRVVHDWDDDEAIALLQAIRRSIPAHGTLLLIESVVPTDNSPHFAKTLDLDMLLFVGGRERTTAQFRELLQRAGFDVSRFIPTVSTLTLIETRPQR